MKELVQVVQDNVLPSEPQLNVPDDIQWMNIEQFAEASGKTQQGVSYLIHKGRLKEFKEEGIRIKKTDKWYIDSLLVQLVKSEQPTPTVDHREALNNQLRSTQTALVKYREFEKRIEQLESENLALVQQVQDFQEMNDATTRKLFDSNIELVQKLEQLSQEIFTLKNKPWWKVW